MPPSWWSAVTPAAPPSPDALLAGAPRYKGPPRGADPNATPADVEGYIRQAAGARGIDPDIAVRVANSEGGMVPNRRGTFKTGSSWTPYQLHYGGKGYEHLGTVAGMGNTFTAKTGYQPGDPEAWQAATDYALDAAKQQGWGAWYGARKQGITGFQGITRGDAAAVPPSGAQPAPAPAAPQRGAPAGPSWWQAVSGPPQGGAAAPAAGGGAARPPAAGPSEPGATPGKQPGWLDLASSQLGKPYIWGSKGGRSDFSQDAAGFDCSGFVSYVYKNSLGVDVPAFTGSAYPATRPVAAAEAQPGDLVFWNMGTPDPRRQHVAIYVGNGQVIQSGGQGDGVNIAPIGQMPGAEFRRVPAAAAALARTADPSAVVPGAPDRPGAVWLQGTVARTPAAPPWWGALTGGRT